MTDFGLASAVICLVAGFVVGWFTAWIYFSYQLVDL